MHVSLIMCRSCDGGVCVFEEEERARRRRREGEGGREREREVT